MMKNEYSFRKAVIAVVLAVMIVISFPVSLVSYTIDMRKSALASFPEDNSVISLNTVADNEHHDGSVPVIHASEVSDADTDAYKEDETMPDSGTVIPPEEILPDKDSGVTEIPDDGNDDVITEDNVTVIPARLNNIMRDSLANIISKKMYTFSADSRSAVVYAFNHVEKTGNDCVWHISLYEEYSPDGTGNQVAYRLLNRTVYENIGKGVQSATIGIMPGNYRVEVECITGFTDKKYDIVIGLTQTDDYETEYNNSPSRYTALPLNKTLNGSASAFVGDVKDEDWYLFRVTETGYSVLYFEHAADAQAMNNATVWRVSVTDMQGNEYYYITSDTAETKINSGVMGLPPGYYYVCVSSHVYSSVTYSLNVSFSKDSAIETELNDTPETADEIAVNTEKVGALTERSDRSDRDWFVFTMERDGFVVIDFIHEALSDDKDGWNISVIAADGRVAYNTVSDRNQPVLQSPSIGLTAGTYHIRIDSDNLYHSSIVYRLILLTVESSGWETEPNNTIETADAVEVGSTVNGTMIEMGTDFDKDYFAIDVPTAGTFSLAFGHIIVNEAGKEGWIVSVLDAEGNILDTLSSDWDSPADVLTLDVDAGTYYILVETGLYFNSGRYVFATSLE